MSYNYDTSSRAVTELDGKNSALEGLNSLTTIIDFDHLFAWLRETAPANLWVPSNLIELFLVVCAGLILASGIGAIVMRFKSRLGRCVAAACSLVGFGLLLTLINSFLLQAGGQL